MIPKIIVLKGSSIESVIAKYENELPVIVDQFEKENGECLIYPSQIYLIKDDYVLTVVIMVNKALAASKAITDEGLGLMNQLQNRLTQVFNSEECDHHWETTTDTDGQEKVACIKCGAKI